MFDLPWTQDTVNGPGLKVLWFGNHFVQLSELSSVFSNKTSNTYSHSVVAFLQVWEIPYTGTKATVITCRPVMYLSSNKWRLRFR